MSKIKISLIAIALIFGLGMAISPKIVKAVATTTQSEDDVLFWYTATGADAGENTRAEEVTDSGCPDSGDFLCEKGYRADQFNTPGVRASGIIPAEVNNYVEIKKVDQQ